MRDDTITLFNPHYNLKDKHAVLSASKYHWLNYTEERLFEYVENLGAARRGTEMHEVAARLIRLGIKQRETNQTFNMYVNDAIGYRMSPEQVLYYSDYAFGTADAICFRDRILRIFDLKNGKTKVSETQLIVYAAYFCLEYGIKRPGDIQYDLRIYQNDEIYQIDVDPKDIVYVVDRIVELNKLITMRMEEGV